MPPTTPAGNIKDVGYIGLGNAGFSMASNFPKAGYKLIVHDADLKKAERAASEWTNTTASGGKAEAFANCQVIITMLPQGKVVREVLLGESGIAKALKPGTIIVDTSSSSPSDTISLGKELAQHSLQLVDSPITQTYMHATDAGESTLLVGCDSEDLFRTVEPVLRTMAGYVFHMGKLSSGHIAKTLNNYVMASSLVALADSLVAGQKAGLRPQQLIDSFNVGTAVNFQTLDPLRRDGLSRKYNSGFGLALLVKDLGITQDFMQDIEFQTELPGLLRKYLQDALQEIEPDADHTKALVGWEKRAGLTLEKTETVQAISEKDFKHRLSGINRGL